PVGIVGGQVRVVAFGGSPVGRFDGRLVGGRVHAQQRVVVGGSGGGHGRTSLSGATRMSRAIHPGGGSGAGDGPGRGSGASWVAVAGRDLVALVHASSLDGPGPVPGRHALPLRAPRRVVAAVAGPQV